MEYMLLIYNNEKAWATMSEAQKGQMFGEYTAFTESIVKSGHFKAGAPLQPTSTRSCTPAHSHGDFHTRRVTRLVMGR